MVGRGSIKVRAIASQPKDSDSILDPSVALNTRHLTVAFSLSSAQKKRKSHPALSDMTLKAKVPCHYQHWST